MTTLTPMQLMDMTTCKIREAQATMIFSALILEEVLPLQISHPHIAVLLNINMCFVEDDKL
jgi:hypothetical protein